MIFDRLAPYYDQFIDPELNVIYLDFVEKYHASGSVIDLGCGTGPVAVELAKKGYYVTATDISVNMLERANNNAVNAGVHIQFYIHDIIEPLNQTFDVFLMTSDVINYLDTVEKVEKAIENVANAMDENGIFIFDFIHLQYVEKMNNYSQDILLDDDVLEWSVHKTNLPNQICHTLKFGREVESHVQTTFPARKYRQIVQQAGLSVVRKKRTDERVIFVCKKK